MLQRSSAWNIQNTHNVIAEVMTQMTDFFVLGKRSICYLSKHMYFDPNWKINTAFCCRSTWTLFYFSDLTTITTKETVPNESKKPTLHSSKKKNQQKNTHYSLNDGFYNMVQSHRTESLSFLWLVYTRTSRKCICSKYLDEPEFC